MAHAPGLLNAQLPSVAHDAQAFEGFHPLLGSKASALNGDACCITPPRCSILTLSDAVLILRLRIRKEEVRAGAAYSRPVPLSGPGLTT